MKKAEDKRMYYFVDESGDPAFYDAKGRLILSKGVSKILLLGFCQLIIQASLEK